MGPCNSNLDPHGLDTPESTSSKECKHIADTISFRIRSIWWSRRSDILIFKTHCTDGQDNIKNVYEKMVKTFMILEKTFYLIRISTNLKTIVLSNHHP